jgi:hypothetical protein
MKIKIIALFVVALGTFAAAAENALAEEPSPLDQSYAVSLFYRGKVLEPRAFPLLLAAGEGRNSARHELTYVVCAGKQMTAASYNEGWDVTGHVNHDGSADFKISATHNPSPSSSPQRSCLEAAPFLANVDTTLHVDLKPSEIFNRDLGEGISVSIERMKVVQKSD